jgi:hypothetical protein
MCAAHMTDTFRGNHRGLGASAEAIAKCSGHLVFALVAVALDVLVAAVALRQLIREFRRRGS